MKKVYFFTNIASHYRSLLWSKVLNSDAFEFHFFYGKNNSFNIKEIDFSKEQFKQNQNKLHQLQNFWVSGKILIWQSGVIRSCLSDKLDVAIFLGEFQIISTWIAMIICKFKGIKVVYWTHGLYGNESKWKKQLRVLFYKTASNLLVYEKRAKELLEKEGIPTDKMEVIYNSLDYDFHLKIREKIAISKINKFKNEFTFENENLPYLVFLGRLTKIKKLDLLLKALHLINKENKVLNLLLIGEGAVKDELRILVDEFSLASNVQFYGACYDEEKLANFIYFSELCVSPGNVGLTAIHSLSFGTPVCTHSNFSNQMPEVESIKEGKTGVFFEENSFESLSKSINSWVQNSKLREEVRKDCFEVIDSVYNPYYQQEVLKKIINS
jgi:glycosyltransferase involved in cell wall biosynthesis